MKIKSSEICLDCMNFRFMIFLNVVFIALFTFLFDFKNVMTQSNLYLVLAVIAQFAFIFIFVKPMIDRLNSQVKELDFEASKVVVSENNKEIVTYLLAEVSALMVQDAYVLEGKWYQEIGRLIKNQSKNNRINFVLKDESTATYNLFFESYYQIKELNEFITDWQQKGVEISYAQATDVVGE